MEFNSELQLWVLWRFHCDIKYGDSHWNLPL